MWGCDGFRFPVTSLNLILQFCLFKEPWNNLRLVWVSRLTILCPPMFVKYESDLNFFFSFCQSILILTFHPWRLILTPQHISRHSPPYIKWERYGWTEGGECILANNPLFVAVVDDISHRPVIPKRIPSRGWPKAISNSRLVNVSCLQQTGQMTLCGALSSCCKGAYVVTSI